MQASDLCPSGRCRFHGGASTGPTTAAGIKRARANLARRWEK
ncbi:HGGxSTG domain-containing protein [Sphingomonas sp. Leaf33]